MDRRILVQVTAPTVVIGLILFGACLVSAWSINHWQTGLSNILSSNVASMESAQELEINLRKLRFHAFRYLLDPQQARLDADLLAELEADDRAFRRALQDADRYAYTPEERTDVAEIHTAYQHYQEQFRTQSQRTTPRRDYQQLAAENPIHPVVDPCARYFDANKEQMNQVRRDSERVSRLLRIVLLLLGLVGPASGLLIGWSMARGLTRSMQSLSVHIQGMVQHLDPEAATVHVVPSGDPGNLNQQLEQVLGRVREMVGQLQQQQRELIHAQQLSALGQLAASVAHEVRNPLMSIKMLVEAALRARNPRPFTRDNLEIVHREVVRLENTVQGFLDFARPPALRRDVCDLRLVMAEALDLVRTRASQQNVVVETDCPPQPVASDVDRAQCRAVLVNLFLNALDAMPAGGCLQVRLKREECELILNVADSGMGIAPEVLKRLFTPFVSGKPTGTGLGLCISRRIIEDHGGHLDGGNRSEGGARFTITLPPASQEKSHAEAAGD
ncbi:MAG TPA: ATP-binding protein [Gemmataceae bacterium]|nr:ATP-binding protein [Gemmataceae bacterium]